MDTDSARASMESVQGSERVPESNESHLSGTCGGSFDGGIDVSVVPPEPSSAGSGGGGGEGGAVNSAAEVSHSVDAGAVLEVVPLELSTEIGEGVRKGEGASLSSVPEVSDSVYSGPALEIVPMEPSSAIDVGRREGTIFIPKERDSAIGVGDHVYGGSTVDVVPFEPCPGIGEGGEGGVTATIVQEGNSVAEINDSWLVGGEMEVEAANLPNFDWEKDYVCRDRQEKKNEFSEKDEQPAFPVLRQEGVENREEGQQEVDGRIVADDEGNGVAKGHIGAITGSDETNAVAAMEEEDPGQVASLADNVDEGEIPDDKVLASIAGSTEILQQDKGLGDSACELGSQLELKEPSQESHDEEVKDATDGDERGEIVVKKNAVDGQCIQGAETEIGEKEGEEKKTDAVEREDEPMMEIETKPQEVDAAEAAETETGARIEEEQQGVVREREDVNMSNTQPRPQEMDIAPGEVAEKNVLVGQLSTDITQFAGGEGNNQETVVVDAEKMVVKDLEAGESVRQVSESTEEVETNAENVAGMEKEGNVIGGVEVAAQMVNAEVVEASEKVTEVGVTKISQVEEKTDVRTEHEIEFQKEADEPKDMETQGDSSVADIVEDRENREDTEMTETQEETMMAETGEEGEDVEEENKSIGAKRKRGRNLKQPKGSAKKKEEDVCFICFDGGDLVLCDRRGCPKAYHPSCVGRDEAFFHSKDKWNCGWHLCSKCEKTATYLCHTCTFSLCKGCVKDSVFFCVRGNKGLCETCMDTVRLIESKEQEKKEPAQLDFDDKSSWEYLFKDYWIDLKAQLSITQEELDQAKSPWKRHGTQATKPETTSKNDYASDGVSDSDSPPKRRKTRRQSKSGGQILSGNDKSSSGENVEWASKELLDVVVHMRHGDRSFLPQSEVHTLLLDYIKRYNLRDPRRKSQVICDSRLQNLFGKSHVGHFEMLNLLDSHFLIKKESHAQAIRSTVVDTEADHVDADESLDHPMKTGKDKKRKTHRKVGSRGRQSNLDDFAAIDMHNINLIYLRRSLVEDVLEDLSSFQEKVVGAFVRLRISGNQKQDLYRLVQVAGTSKAVEPYKVGKKTTDFVLEILNLDKTEVISVDIISNQDFTEDECKRLRQSIKCGFISRLTVGGIQEKAIALQEVRVKNLLEGEIVRLSHLRDRASDMGRRKELRECVEKLQVLKSPEERQRRLEEIPEIHVDPSMDPDCESEDEDEKEEKQREKYLRPRSSSFNRRGREPISPRAGGYGSSYSWGGTRNYSSENRELSRNLSGRGFSSRGDNPAGGSGDRANESLWTSGRDRELQQSASPEKPGSVSQSSNRVGTAELSPRVGSEISPAPLPTSVTEPISQINESEKMWHYKDPSGKVQGPFSMVQLRKWNNTGYFPADLKIWKAKETQDDSVPLADALAGRFPKQTQTGIYSVRASCPSSQSAGGGLKSEPEFGSSGRTAPSTLEIPKSQDNTWGPSSGSGTNLPSPTPNQTTTPTATRRRSYESRWSSTPAQTPVQSTVQLANSFIPPSATNPVSARPDVPMTHVGSAMALPSLTPAGLNQGRGTMQAKKLDSSGSTQIPSHGHIAPSSSQSSSPSFNAGTPGLFPAQFQSGIPPSDSWRVPVPIQPNTQAPVPLNLPWGMNAMNSNNQNAPQTQAPVIQSSGWGQMPVNPNIGWMGTPQAGANPNWGSSGWGGQPQVYPNPGWGMTGQAEAPLNTGSGHGPKAGNGNLNWGLSSHGPSPGGAAAMWGNQQNQNGGGDSTTGYGWNRNLNGQRICKFFRENGYCRKGATCDYIHN